MAEIAAFNPQASLLLLLRQAGVLIGLAAAIALGLYVALWARTPEFTVLYTDLAERDLTQVVEALQSNAIPYRMDTRSGAILVAADHVDDARLKLASAGLPHSSAAGVANMGENQGFGTSQFLEQARYQYAIEGELSRSIAHISNVRAARVHLAVPKQTAFARAGQNPTASVIVDLYNGRRLETHQVGAIVQMVSAAVPGLAAEQVTVIDQQGNLLTDGRDAQGGPDGLAVSAKRLDYARRLEQSYIERVEAILAPLVGPDGVRAQVTADVDFTDSEQTRESFNPDLPSVRSESTVQEERAGDAANGVPGALSNVPPTQATAPEQTPPAGAPTAGATGAPRAPTASPVPTPSNKRNQSTRNYELDRTISHTKSAVGSLRRLSVAVVVRTPPPAAPDSKVADEKSSDPKAAAGKKSEVATADSNTAAKPALGPAEIERMTNLVKEAVGFDAMRGDSVSITAAEFLAPATPEALPEPPIWKQPWVWSIAKQVLGGLFVLFVLFGVIKPTVKSLMPRPLQTSHDGVTVEGGLVGAGNELAALPAGAADARPGAQQLLAASELDPNIESVKQFVNQDPRVAAQVVRAWVGE